MFSCNAIVKRWREDYCLSSLGFTFQGGDIIALAGGNGAGKSTFFELISGRLKPDSGTPVLHYEGQNLPVAVDHNEAKRHIGYLPQNSPLPEWATGHDILTYSSALYGIKGAAARIAELSQLFSCETYIHRPLGLCSHGMKKRIGLCLALLHDPYMLILDEPFSGLDLFHVKTLHEVITSRKPRGLITIVSTHIFPYIARWGDRALIIKNGFINEIQGFQTFPPDAKIQALDEAFFSP